MQQQTTITAALQTQRIAHSAIIEAVARRPFSPFDDNGGDWAFWISENTKLVYNNVDHYVENNFLRMKSDHIISTFLFSKYFQVEIANGISWNQSKVGELVY